MSQIVSNCPRCGSQHITFDVLAAIPIARRYNWQTVYEVFGRCRHCHRSTVLTVSERGIDESEYIEENGLVKPERSINDLVKVEGFVSLKDHAREHPPDHLPEDIRSVFLESATCLAVGCFNAAGTMFRLCVDLATRSLLPEEDRDGLNSKIRRSLGLRLEWMFDNHILPTELRDLSSCIKEDGNDGAHAGTLTREDAHDLLDFTVALLERLYTEPERLRQAQERRESRRKEKG